MRPSSMQELLNILSLHKGKPFFILGNGTNTLFADGIYNGLVIHTTALNQIKIINNPPEKSCLNENLKINQNSIPKTTVPKNLVSDNYKNAPENITNTNSNLTENFAFGEDVFLSVECGVDFFDLHKFLAENSLSGFEFAFGIPASVGGAIKGNAGAFNGACGDFVEEITIFQKGAVKTLKKGEFQFAYRKSSLGDDAVILSAVFRFKKGDKNLILQKQQEFWQKRKARQPLEFASAGSVFKKDGTVFPAQIIERLGLKGMRVGGAEISQKHAGFIINTGTSTASDIISLITQIENIVKSKLNISLKREIIIIPPH